MNRDDLLKKLEAKKKEILLLEQEFANLSTTGRQPHVICYGRQSRDDVMQPFSEQTQEAQLDKYVQYRFASLTDAVVVPSFIDIDTSASIPLFERKEGRKVNLILERGDHFVTPKVDRAFRCSKDAAICCELLQARGVNIHFLDLMIDTTTAGGRFALSVMVAASQMERCRTSERIRETFDRLRAQGRPAFGAIGWLRIGKKEAAQLVPDVAMREYCNRLAELVYKRGYTVTDAMRKFVKDGIAKPNGKINASISNACHYVVASRLGFPKFAMDSCPVHLTDQQIAHFHATGEWPTVFGTLRAYTPSGRFAVRGGKIGRPKKEGYVGVGAVKRPDIAERVHEAVQNSKGKDDHAA